MRRWTAIAVLTLAVGLVLEAGRPRGAGADGRGFECHGCEEGIVQTPGSTPVPTATPGPGGVAQLVPMRLQAARLVPVSLR